MERKDPEKLPETIIDKIAERNFIQGAWQIRNIGYEFPRISDMVQALDKSPPIGYTWKWIDYQNGIKELILYAKPQAVGFKRKHTPQRKENRTMRNEQNAKRARQNVFRLVEANLTPYTKFVTLTYRDENMTDYDKMAKDYKAFIRHLKRKGYNFPYLWVIEYQFKRQEKYNLKAPPLHAHALFFTDEYIPHDALAKAWPHGFVKINAQWDKVDHKGAYVAKYINKDTIPPDKKAYRTSKDIKRPTTKVGLGSFTDALPHTRLNGYKRVSKHTYSIPSLKDTVNYQSGEIIPYHLDATVHVFEKRKDYERTGVNGKH